MIPWRENGVTDADGTVQDNEVEKAKAQYGDPYWAFAYVYTAGLRISVDAS